MKNTFVLIFLAAGIALAQAQQTVKVMHYNLLGFGDCPGVTTQQKYAWLGTILNDYRPDIFTVNELSPNAAYVNGIKALSFSYTSAVDNAEFTNYNESFIVNQLFYNTDLFVYESVDTIKNSLRDINVYTLYFKQGLETGDTTRLYCIVAHFKAATGAANSSQRNTSARSIMSWMAREGSGKNVLVMGDFNVYSAAEAAFQTMVFHPNPNIRLQDVSGNQGGWDGPSNASVHTQSTRSSSGDCGSGGGMDDRFDMILASQSITNHTLKLSYVEDSYKAYGNDGNSYNFQLGCTNSPVATNVCQALRQMSDHLPVVMELQFDGAVSIENKLDAAGLEIHIALNPDQAQWDLHFDGETSQFFPLELRLMDMTGRIKMRTKLSQSSSFSIPHHHLSNGVYLLHLQDKSGRYWRKKIVNR